MLFLQQKHLKILQFDIETHNRNYISLYPKSDGSRILTPKFHALLHLPSQIRLFGPPRDYWCFRYESKNAPLKKIMRRNCNFLNVPCSIATHVQRYVGLDVRTHGEGDFFETESHFKTMSRCNVSSSKPQLLASQSPWATLFEKSAPSVRIDPKSPVLKILSGKIAGRLCQRHTIFLQQLPNLETLPKFFRIADMLCLLPSDQIVLVMEEMETLFFSRDRFSFIVKPLGTFLVMKDCTLKFNCPLQSFFFKGQIHVVPNYYHLL